MIDPVSLISATLAVAKTLGGAISYLLNLQGTSRRIQDHLNDARHFRRLLEQTARQLSARGTRFADSFADFLLDILHDSQTTSNRYSKLLEEAAWSNCKILKWKRNETELEELQRRLGSKSSDLRMVLMIISG